MKTRLYEWKKVMNFQKSLILILLFVILRILGLCLFDEPTDADIENNKETYTLWLSQVEGKLDDEKQNFIEEISLQYTSAESRLQRIYQDISENPDRRADLETEMSELSGLMEMKKGFNVLFEQYRSVREQKENRYLLDTNGWNGILAGDKLNYLLIIIVSVFGIRIFGIEQENEMFSIIKTSKEGERKTVLKKLFSLCLLIVLVVVIDFFIGWIFYDLKYGFSHGEYPLQSLDYFKEYSQSVDLYSAMLAIFFIRLTGYIYLGILSCAAIVILKKHSVSLLVIFSMILLPYYGVGTEYLKFYIPLPLGMMIGNGYFMGNRYAVSEISGETEYVFREIGYKEFLFIFMIMVVIMTAIVIFIFRVYTNEIHRRKMKRILLPVLLLIGISSLIACRESAEPENVENYLNIYNYDNIRTAENEKYIFYLETSSDEKRFMYVDKESGESGKLIKDVFFDSKYMKDFFYVSGNKVYYMVWTPDEEERGMVREFDTVSIICIDTDTFETETIFSDNAKINSQYILGLGHYYNENVRFYSCVESIIVRDDTIYFVTADEVWKMNAHTKKREYVLTYFGNYLSFKDNDIFYLDYMSRLTEYDMLTGQETVYDEVVAEKFYLRTEDIIYSNRKDNLYLYSYSFDTKENRKVLEENVYDFTTDGNDIFFVNMSNELYQLNDRDNRLNCLKDRVGTIIYAFRSYNRILIYDETWTQVFIDKIADD